MRRILRPAFGLPLLLGLAACTGASNNVMDSAFPVSRMTPQGRLAGLEPPPSTSFTVDRVLGRPDGLQPLGEDQTLFRAGADGRSIRDLLDVEGTRRSYFDQLEQQPPPPTNPPPSPPRARGSSTPPQANVLPEANAPVVRAPAPPPAPAPSTALTPGTTIPGPRGGATVGGSAGSTATTVGPSGQSGTATRDGGTVTLFGADGSIRTVPAPQR